MNLEIIGMRHQQNLYDLRKGLVRPRGRFRVLDNLDGHIVDITNETGGEFKSTEEAVWGQPL